MKTVNAIISKNDFLRYPSSFLQQWVYLSHEQQVPYTITEMYVFLASD